MVARTVSDADVALGRAILLATDVLGMSAEGAFWLYDTKEKKWRYFLATSLFRTLGPREIYLRLTQALAKKLSEREIREFHVFLGDPNESIVRAIRAATRTDMYASEPKEIAVNLDREHTKAIVYRMA